MGDWGSKLLFKARTGTLELDGRNREGDQICCCRAQNNETVQHMIVECSNYERQRARLMDSVITVIGREEWNRRIEEEDGAICTVLGLYGDRKEAETNSKLHKGVPGAVLEGRAQRRGD